MKKLLRSWMIAASLVSGFGSFHSIQASETTDSQLEAESSQNYKFANQVEALKSLNILEWISKDHIQQSREFANKLFADGQKIHLMFAFYSLTHVLTPEGVDANFFSQLKNHHPHFFRYGRNPSELAHFIFESEEKFNVYKETIRQALYGPNAIETINKMILWQEEAKTVIEKFQSKNFLRGGQAENFEFVTTIQPGTLHDFWGTFALTNIIKVIPYSGNYGNEYNQLKNKVNRNEGDASTIVRMMANQEVMYTPQSANYASVFKELCTTALNSINMLLSEQPEAQQTAETSRVGQIENEQNQILTAYQAAEAASSAKKATNEQLLNPATLTKEHLENLSEEQFIFLSKQGFEKLSEQQLAIIVANKKKLEFTDAQLNSAEQYNNNLDILIYLLAHASKITSDIQDKIYNGTNSGDVGIVAKIILGITRKHDRLKLKNLLIQMMYSLVRITTQEPLMSENEHLTANISEPSITEHQATIDIYEPIKIDAFLQSSENTLFEALSLDPAPAEVTQDPKLNYVFETLKQLYELTESTNPEDGIIAAQHLFRNDQFTPFIFFAASQLGEVNSEGLDNKTLSSFTGKSYAGYTNPNPGIWGIQSEDLALKIFSSIEHIKSFKAILESVLQPANNDLQSSLNQMAEWQKNFFDATTKLSQINVEMMKDEKYQLALKNIWTITSLRTSRHGDYQRYSSTFTDKLSQNNYNSFVETATSQSFERTYGKYFREVIASIIQKFNDFNNLKTLAEANEESRLQAESNNALSEAIAKNPKITNTVAALQQLKLFEWSGNKNNDQEQAKAIFNQNGNLSNLMAHFAITQTFEPTGIDKNIYDGSFTTISGNITYEQYIRGGIDPFNIYQKGVWGNNPSGTISNIYKNKLIFDIYKHSLQQALSGADIESRMITAVNWLETLKNQVQECLSIPAGNIEQAKQVFGNSQKTGVFSTTSVKLASIAAIVPNDGPTSLKIADVRNKRIQIMSAANGDFNKAAEAIIGNPELHQIFSEMMEIILKSINKLLETAATTETTETAATTETTETAATTETTETTATTATTEAATTETATTEAATTELLKTKNNLLVKAEELDRQAEKIDSAATEKKAEMERLAAEKAEQTRQEADKKAEEERIAAEKAQQEKIAAEKKAEMERIAAEKAEQARQEADKKAEEERIAAEKAKQEKQEAKQRAEKDRIAKEAKLEAERLAEEARIAEQAKQDAERQAEKERIAAEKAEQKRIAADIAAKQARLAEQATQAIIAAEKAKTQEVEIFTQSTLPAQTAEEAEAQAKTLENLAKTKRDRAALLREKAESIVAT